MSIGFDLESLNYGLLLSLPFPEGTGSVSTVDVAKPRHPITMVHVPTWTKLSSGVQTLNFPDVDDYLMCPAASCTDLDFTSGSFSACVWYYDVPNTRNIPLFQRGVLNTSGWMLYLSSSWGLTFYTWGSTDRSSQAATIFPIVSQPWCLLGFSREGTSGRLFVNGRDVTTTAQAHTDPASSGADLEIAHGVTINEIASLQNPRIWNRKLDPYEHKMIFDTERHLFGV